jgi:tocopherol cyclase
MLNFVHAVLNPDIYHGSHKTGPFFEGWYFKLIDASQQKRLCIIPGVYSGKNPADTHAFIQVMDGVSGKSSYQPFDCRDFTSREDRFEVNLAGSCFTAHGIRLDIVQPELSLHGELNFGQVSPWPVSLFSPGIMGWYAWVPGMECYHGVVSLDHTLQGSLEINGEKVDFSGGRGYTEKDWGKSFPRAWVWMQTNHFSQPGSSLTFSAAIIPWGKSSFDGFIAGMLTGGRLHRFATYTGAHLDECTVGEDIVHAVLSDRSSRLEVTATQTEGGILRAPTLTQMDRRITETLSAQVQVKLSLRQGGRWSVEFEDTGRHGGLEVNGKLNLD